MLSEAHGKAAVNGKTCREWYHRFKDCDFYVEDQHSGGRPKIIENANFLKC